MNLNYDQVTGHITNDEGKLLATGWSGNGDGKNNPAMQDVHSVGPLPQGVYKVCEWEYEHNGLGHDVVAILQVEGETFGRDGFFIHGPAINSEHYGQESKGCIVVPREGRLYIQSLHPDTVTVHGPENESVAESVVEPEVPTEAPAGEVS